MNLVTPPGEHTVTFNAADLPRGTCLYRLRGGDFTAVKKLLVLKELSNRRILRTARSSKWAGFCVDTVRDTCDLVDVTVEWVFHYLSGTAG